MAMSGARRDDILAIDIGATSIKIGTVTSDADLLGALRTVPTPYPCTPERLIGVVTSLIAESLCQRIGVGFPGELRDNVVVEPGNLSRIGGITTSIDASIHEAWINLDLQHALRERSHREVRVVNDATLAALGYCDGRGIELVFTLGTGFGIALLVNGVPVKIRDVGAEVFVDGLTYDEALGETARSQDPIHWIALLHQAIVDFVGEFGPGTIHLGGGNARRVDTSEFTDIDCRIVINDNDATLRGVARLFASSRRS